MAYPRPCTGIAWPHPPPAPESRQSPVDISVIVCTHNPHPGRLRPTLAGLRAQTLPVAQWETILVDNASQPAVTFAEFFDAAPANVRGAREAQLGLNAARRHGLTEAGGKLIILVDDDNVLAADYLAETLRLFAALPRVGAMGGKSTPEFDVAPPAWAREFFPLLALRDLGDATLISQGIRPPGAVRNQYPPFAPIGAGMALRREAVARWLAAGADGLPADRRGNELTSGGDNDIIFSVLESGWEVAYAPKLRLTHLISAARLRPDYLARLNRGIQQSWMQVLYRHEASPWPPLTRTGAMLRQVKAWFTCRAWRGAAEQIRWQGIRGHFAGRVPRPGDG